jgi:hypothetical protein
MAGSAHGLTLLCAVVLAAFFTGVLNEGIARWQRATNTTALEACVCTCRSGSASISRFISSCNRLGQRCPHERAASDIHAHWRRDFADMGRRMLISSAVMSSEWTGRFTPSTSVGTLSTSWQRQTSVFPCCQLSRQVTGLA